MKQFLQPTVLNVVVAEHSAMGKVRNELVTVPQVVPVGMVVAVKPDDGADQYWLAKVSEVTSKQPLKYKLHYYEHNKQLKAWKLMKGKFSVGSCPHGAVLFAGVEFNQNGSMKKDSAEKIKYMLTKDN